MKSSTWSNQPTSSEWNASTNWDPATVPTDVATFSKSSQTAITFTAESEASVNEIEFTADAPPFKFTINTSTKTTLTISGEGILNNSESLQNFVVASKGVSYKNPQLKFEDSASAGDYNTHYYAGPESLENGYGGGIIGFCDNSTAGSASFTVRTGALRPPGEYGDSTVGAEVAFSDSSSAGNARFTIFGTLGTDGDTFGNTVFHDTATAASATFANIGGTVSGGDGGNTQFYDSSTAASGLFHNYGATHSEGNGGDVAFDGVASGGNASFHNYPALAHGGHGGVTSFNNNPPEIEPVGATAGNGYFYNYGAQGAGQGGGGHTEFTALHGSPTAGNAQFVNYGSVLDETSSAGHTIFSVTVSITPETDYFPTAAGATFFNMPGTTEGSSPGYTSFSVNAPYPPDDPDSWSIEEKKYLPKFLKKYSLPENSSSWNDAQKAVFANATAKLVKARKINVPTGGEGCFINQGSSISGTDGGYTSFSTTASAGSAVLIAQSGSNGGQGGKIVFYDNATADGARVKLFGNGELDLGRHNGGLSIAELELSGGLINTALGAHTTLLTVSGKILLTSSPVTFSFYVQENDDFDPKKSYTILKASNTSDFSADQFEGNNIVVGTDSYEPKFTLAGHELRVSFSPEKHSKSP